MKYMNMKSGCEMVNTESKRGNTLDELNDIQNGLLHYCYNAMLYEANHLKA
jgi:hypothetical protein